MRARIVALASVLSAILVMGCGSSTSSSTPATQKTSGATTTRAASFKEPLPGTQGRPKGITATLHLQPSRLHAHLAGYPLQLPQKIAAMATDVAQTWSPLQLPPATLNIVARTPVSCQSTQGAVQVSTADPPLYCLSDASLEVPVGFIQSKVEPIGDAAVLLVVADLYGYHILNAEGQLNPSAGLSAAQVVKRDACVGGMYFSFIPTTRLSAADTDAVNKEILAITAPGTAAAANAVTAQDLTDAFNKGIFARGHLSRCLR